MQHTISEEGNKLVMKDRRTKCWEHQSHSSCTVRKEKPCFTHNNLAVDFLLYFTSSSEQNPELQKQNSAATAELSVKAQSLTNVIFLSPGLQTGGCAAAEPWQPSGGEWQFDTALSPSRRLLHLTQALGPVLGTR